MNAAYPGLVDNVIAHEGIGFVIAYEDDFTPVAFGKRGARNLNTGAVVGEDPLEPFGDVELRSWQLKRLADFENSGDLILNSTLYPDGTVAALEELIGNHGGLGGEQTDAYMFHPGDMVIPPTRGSFEFKAILDARRGLPGPTPKPARPPETIVDPWSLSTMGKGLAQVGKWVNLALHALILQREAYREIAGDVYMTAPALLISLVAQTIQSWIILGRLDVLNILLRYALWFVSVFFLFIAARLLHGKHRFTTTLRVVGFAQSAQIFELLAFLPVFGATARFLSVIWSVFAVWIGVATANDLKGWRTIILPVLYLLVTVISLGFLAAALAGTAYTLNELQQSLGFAGQ